MSRGVRRGDRRGDYRRAGDDVRQRVIDAFENGDDWVQCAEHNGVKYATAYRWIKRGRVENLPRGGLRQNIQKLQEVHINGILDQLSQNCLLTLQQLSEFIRQQYDIVVSNQTISRVLNGRHFTIKKWHHEP